MWSWTLSEINVGHLRKVSLILLRLLLLIGIFLQKKRLLLVEKFLFLFDAYKTSFNYHYFILWWIAVCRQIMLAIQRPFDITFSQIVES